METTDTVSESRSSRSPLLIIACGALAHELMDLVRVNQWDEVKVKCLPAEWHNTPNKIPDGVRQQIRKYRSEFDRIFVAYADCGTGGLLDNVLVEEGVDRLPGAHCYEFFAGRDTFARLSESELGTFYLTDFLAWHFERIIVRGFGLDRHPEMKEMMFANYKKVVYISQTHNTDYLEKAQAAAQTLGLGFEHIHTGYGELTVSLESIQRK